jgi:Ca-activated chloride channel homolog
VPANPRALRTVAQTARGESFTADDAERLETVYEQLASRIGTRDEEREISDVFSGGAALLLLGAGGLSVLWFRRVP